MSGAALPAAARPWLRTLEILALLHLAGGLALPLLVALDAVPAALLPPGAPFWLAVFGPTVASWGLLMLALLRLGVARGDVRAVNALILAVLVWAPLDAAVCAAYGFWPGVLIDTLVVPMLLLPLLRLRALLPRG